MGYRLAVQAERAFDADFDAVQEMGSCPMQRIDPRVARSRRALRDALADEIHEVGDLTRVTATSLAERAGVTRRTFYTHFRDISDLVDQVENEAIDELDAKVRVIADVTLADMSKAIEKLAPVPGSVELLDYIRENGSFYQALLGEGGDPAFAEKIKEHLRGTITPRALTGIAAPAVGSFVEYYITFAISAEMGVLMRWLAGGMVESSGVMARIMTALMFVRPGDLYGAPISFDIPRYGLALTLLSAYPSLDDAGKKNSSSAKSAERTKSTARTENAAEAGMEGVDSHV